MTDAPDYEPATHYDRVTAAWGLLLGPELHYGVFATGDEPLSVATAELTNRMVAAARFEAGQRLLDVGCGTGTPACHVARHCAVAVVGISTSAEGVAAANARAAGLGADASFALRDGLDNGYPDESFDRVWALESSHLIRDRRRFVEESSRVLKPGGRLIVCDLIRRRVVPFTEVRDRQADFITLREAFGDAHLESLSVYRGALEAAGIEVDVEQDLTAETVPTFDRWRANLDAHRTEVTELLGADGVDAFDRSTLILQDFWRDGTFGYGLMAGVKRRR